MPPLALGPPLPIPPALWDPAVVMQASHGTLALCDPSPASHSTSPSGTQASRSMGPWQQASHVCKPSSSPSTPPLCPPLTGMGMGAVGPSPRFVRRLGLRVSSRGLRFSLYPPPFLRRLVPCAFWVRHHCGPPVSRRPAAHTGAGALSRYRSAAPGPQCGFPLRALLPLTRLCRLIPSAALNRGSQATLSHAYWVQSTQQDSGSCCVHPFR